MPFVYMIKNDFVKLYIGITDILPRRLHDHNDARGAKFTTGKAKFRLVFLEEHVTLSEARHREIQIKKWRREKKDILIDRFQKGLPTKL